MRWCKIAPGPDACKQPGRPCCKDCESKPCRARCLNDPKWCGCWEDDQPFSLGYSISGVNMVLKEMGVTCREKP